MIAIEKTAGAWGARETALLKSPRGVEFSYSSVCETFRTGSSSVLDGGRDEARSIYPDRALFIRGIIMKYRKLGRTEV